MKTYSIKQMAGLLTGLTIVAFGTAPVQAADTEIFKDSLGEIMVGDIQGFLDSAGALAEKVSPGMKASSLKMQAGIMLGDPGLDAIPPGSGVLTVIPDEGMPFGFIELNPAKATAYLDLLTSRGISSAKAGDGLYALAISPDAAKDAAEKHGKAAANALKGKGAPSFVCTFEIARLLAKFKAPIEDGIKSMPEKMAAMRERMAKSGASSNVEAMEAADKMMPVFLNVIYAMAKRVEWAKLTIKLSSDGVQIDKSIKPVRALTEPKLPSRTGADLLKLLADGGTMDYDCTIDPKACAATVSEVWDEVAKASGDSSKIRELASWSKDYLSALDGAMAARMMINDGKFGGAFAIGVTDEAKVRALIAQVPEKIKSIGLLKFYESMGIKADFIYKPAVREYDGVKIDEMAVKVDAESSATPQMARMMKAYGDIRYDLAIVNKVLLYSSAPQRIETLIDHVKKGEKVETKGLVSASKLPQGGCFYMDYDIGKVMEMTTAQLPPDSKEREAMGKLIESITGYPLLFAAYHKPTTLDFIMLIPAELIKAAANGVGQMAAKRSESFKEGIETTAPVATP